jgi:hypothetical protein
MQLRVLLGTGALALALTGAAIVLWPRAEPRPAAPRPVPPAPSTTPRNLPDHEVADALQRVLDPPPEPEMKLPPAAARKAAEESFEAIMQTLETLGDAGKRLPRARRDELYRNTNDAFSALSATLDAENSAEDRQALEDANIRMKAMLTELGVRVPKRPPPRFAE